MKKNFFSFFFFFYFKIDFSDFRFEFDYEQVKNLKINDRCQFPLELDMYPFSKEALEER